MNKKNDCRIIEDLLLSYIDGILNSETKDFVEKHLSQCNECKQKLEELKSSILEENANDKKCIDYLKKAKRKERIRTIKWIIFAIFVLLILIYFRNFIIINNIFNKSNTHLSGNNIYIQIVKHLNHNTASVSKYYYKDGKVKITEESYNPDDSVDLYNTMYFDMNSEEFINTVPLQFVNQNRISTRILAPFVSSIHSEELHTLSNDNSKKCYIITERFGHSNNHEIWIDQKTGLPLKEVNAGMATSFYKNTTNNTYSDIWKEYTDTIIEYKYEFDVVTDEDVTE